MITLHHEQLEHYLSQRYRIILSPEADSWSATIPDLPGCIAAGDSIEETLSLLDDARHSWIEASLLRDLLIPEPT